MHSQTKHRGVEQLVARQAHNLEVACSSPAPATLKQDTFRALLLSFPNLIAHDNARLNTINEKYVLLREFARPNEEWAKKADYIEFLYTDEAEHPGRDTEALGEQTQAA